MLIPLQYFLGYNFTSSSIENVEDSILTQHRIAEAFKFAYGKRSALGDQNFTDVDEVSFIFFCFLTTKTSYHEYSKIIRKNDVTNVTALFLAPHEHDVRDIRSLNT